MTPTTAHAVPGAKIRRKVKESGAAANGSADGVKAIDVCWLAPGREAEVETVGCLRRAPEICVEIWSPSNRPGEIERKRELYLEAGAREVWVCGLDGSMHFHSSPGGSRLARPELCPAFPGAVLPSRLKEA